MLLLSFLRLTGIFFQIMLGLNFVAEVDLSVLMVHLKCVVIQYITIWNNMLHSSTFVIHFTLYASEATKQDIVFCVCVSAQ